MIESFIILNYMETGVWSNIHKRFKGPIFATKYISEQDAKNAIAENSIKNAYIVKTYG